MGVDEGGGGGDAALRKIDFILRFLDFCRILEIESCTERTRGNNIYLFFFLILNLFFFFFFFTIFYYFSVRKTDDSMVICMHV